jgi:tetratricopeptide (TPR) repeat protein
MINFINEIDDSLKSSVIKTAKDAKNTFLTGKDLQLLADYIIEGKDKVDIAVLDAEYGSKLLSEKKYMEGINYLEKALLVRKNNVGYIQTIGLAYHNLGEHKKAVENLGILENNGIPLDPVSLYVKGLSHYFLKQKEASCKYLLKASRFGLKSASEAYEDLCKL